MTTETTIQLSPSINDTSLASTIYAIIAVSPQSRSLELSDVYYHHIANWQMPQVEVPTTI